MKENELQTTHEDAREGLGSTGQGKRIGARVLRDGQESKKVKNLGWLLRNWKSVKHFGFFLKEDRSSFDGHLVAYMGNGDKYVTEYACWEVCQRWLCRPVFYSLRIKVSKGENAEWFTIAKGGLVKD